MAQAQGAAAVPATAQGNKVALTMVSVRKVISDLPELDLAQIEEAAGHLLPKDFALEHRAETNVVGALIAAVKALAKAGVNLQGLDAKKRQEALYAFKLISARVRELYATRKNQVNGGTFVFNFPLPVGHPMCAIVAEMLDHARLAYPADASVEIPKSQIRFLGAASGMDGGHSVKLLAAAEARKKATEKP